MSKLFNFFSGNSGMNKPELSKEKIAKQKKLNLKNFFGYVKRNFFTISTANLLFTLCNIWIVVVLLGMTGNFDTFVPTASNPLYAQLYAMLDTESGPAFASLYGILGATSEIRIYSTLSYVLLGFSALVLFTNGIANVGMFYMLRATVNGDYTSSASEFFYAIKRNFKQAFCFGIIDVAIIGFLVYDIIAYGANATVSLFYQLSLYLIIAVVIIYYIMRGYIYVMIISFDLPLRKLFKNAFLMTCLGYKRNLMALLGSVAILLLNYFIMSFLFGVGILLPFMITVALTSYTVVYASWPVIDKYMVQPYYTEHPDERPYSGDNDNGDGEVYTNDPV